MLAILEPALEPRFFTPPLLSFGARWLAAWNSHNPVEILAMYSDRILVSSPIVERVLGGGSDRILGKPHLKKFVLRALACNPDLRLSLESVSNTSPGLTIRYTGLGEHLSTDRMMFDSRGRISTVLGHLPV